MPANWFIALPVRSADLPAGLIDHIPSGLRRFAPEDLHLTVAFLGAVGEPAAHAAWNLVDAMHDGPFRPETGALAAFGNPRRPSAYGVELGAGGDAVRTFIAAWRDRFRTAAGRGVEQRDVRPHVTLARPPRGAGTALRKRAERWMAGPPLAATVLDLDRIALYTRSSAASAHRFRCVAQRALPPAVPVPE